MEMNTGMQTKVRPATVLAGPPVFAHAMRAARLHWQTIEFAGHAVELGSRLVDQLHLPSYRPQPAGRRQIHARRNYSTLLVLRKDVS